MGIKSKWKTSIRYPIYLDKETIIGKHKDLYGNQTDNSRSYEIPM